MNEKFIYEKSNDFKNIYIDDILTCVVNNCARLTLIDTRLPFPEKSESNDSGNLIIKNKHESNIFLKEIKGDLIIPIDRLPSIIENLNQLYSNYKKIKNKE